MRVFFCYGHIFRTNNAIEGWHHRLNGLIRQKSSVYFFLQLLKKEAHFQSIKLQKSHLYTKGKKRRKMDLEKDQMMEKYIQSTLRNEIYVKYRMLRSTKLRERVFFLT